MIDESARNRVFAEHRFGRIEVTIDAMRGQPAEMMRVLSDMLVLRAETLIFRNVIAYEVACAELDPVPEGSELPLYHVIVHTKAGKFSHRTFEKVKA